MEKEANYRVVQYMGMDMEGDHNRQCRMEADQEEFVALHVSWLLQVLLPRQYLHHL